jgi:hypothetical protein
VDGGQWQVDSGQAFLSMIDWDEVPSVRKTKEDKLHRLSRTAGAFVCFIGAIIPQTVISERKAKTGLHGGSGGRFFAET